MKLAFDEIDATAEFGNLLNSLCELTDSDTCGGMFDVIELSTGKTLETVCLTALQHTQYSEIAIRQHFTPLARDVNAILGTTIAKFTTISLRSL